MNTMNSETINFFSDWSLLFQDDLNRETYHEYIMDGWKESDRRQLEPAQNTPLNSINYF